MAKQESAAEWFQRFPDLGTNPLFTLRFRLSGCRVRIRAWEGPPQIAVGSHPTHTTLFCELRTDMDKPGRPLFPRSDYWVGVPNFKPIDGKYARELAVSLFCMKPGDTDAEFFAAYTPAQLEFVRLYGEQLDMERDRRYCDSETGEVRA